MAAVLVLVVGSMIRWYLLVLKLLMLKLKLLLLLLFVVSREETVKEVVVGGV